MCVTGHGHARDMDHRVVSKKLSPELQMSPLFQGYAGGTVEGTPQGRADVPLNKQQETLFLNPDQTEVLGNMVSVGVSLLTGPRCSLLGVPATAGGGGAFGHWSAWPDVLV